jgi:hypothetical protein
MKARDAAELWRRAGFRPPPDIDEPRFEKIAGTIRKKVDGIEFRSTLESRCYQLFNLWQQSGEIRNLELQPKFVLQPKMRRDGKALREITYTADFRFDRKFAGEWKPVVVDSKGFRTEVYRIKAKMFRALYPQFEFQEWDRERLKRESSS